MGTKRRPTGHVQVKLDKNGQRAYWAFWRDVDGKRGGRRLGPAHVRDSGRRSPRGAIIWRAGHGTRPTPEHLTPQDAEDQLDDILRKLRDDAQIAKRDERQATLRDVTEGWVAERMRERGLKRSTLAGYENMFERLYRDLGAETQIGDFADGRLRAYFSDFKSYKVLGERAAKQARAEGKDVRQVEIECWTARPPGSEPVEVGTKAEALRLADELPGTWKHRRRGVYRVVPLNARRARRVSFAKAKALEAQGWIVARRRTRPWMLVVPAAAQTRNAYRDILSACLDYAVREHLLDVNPLVQVKRTSKREERERILRREDFYEPREVDRLLAHAPSLVEEAFWLCGAHAGLRLPGEALGLKWGAVDFQALVLRPYDNWVLEELDTTKTRDLEAIPMTPRLIRALMKVKQRAFATSDDDFVFAQALMPDRPISPRPLRDAFKEASREAGLKPIKMYNLRHSFGTSLAAKGVDIRTIQALMRHARMSTTEQYMAYAPRPDLAAQIARALDPHSVPEGVLPIRRPHDFAQPATGPDGEQRAYEAA